MTSKLTALLFIAVLSGGLVACAGAEDVGETSALRTSSPAANQTSGASLKVPARANIFGAGRSDPPAPGGGGAGVLPTARPLPQGSGRVVTFPSVTGRVVPIEGATQANGPAGDGTGPTNVESFEGISGIVHEDNGMFLVGVFLTDAVPSQPAPPRLVFTDREQFNLLEPRIGQTFLIGDGKGRRYRIPADATRLFLGFADGYYYQGFPGWYDNNTGQLAVTIAVAGGEARSKDRSLGRIRAQLSAGGLLCLLRKPAATPERRTALLSRPGVR